MKKAYQYIALAALALSFAACSQEEDYTPQGNQKDAPLAIASAGVAELTTRATINNNNLEGGSIGVYVNSETGGRYSGDNIKWTYGNDGWQLENATVVLYENNGEKQQIAAYYPYNENLGTGNVYSITLPEAYGEDYENYDYLYGEYAQLSDNPATIALNHLMAKVTVNVQATGTELGSDNAKSISLMNVPRTATWTLPGATLSEYGNAGSIDLYNNNGSYCGYALPNEAEALTLRITTENGRTFTATASLDDATTADKTEVLTNGKHYKIGVKVGKDKAEISSVSVADWADGETLEGSVAEECTHENVVNGICTNCGLEINSVYDKTTNTYTVYTEAGLQEWHQAAQTDLTTNLTLAADITLSATTADGTAITVTDGVPSGSNWTPRGTDYNHAFTGTIDGGGHTLSGLRISSTTSNTGFIGYLGIGGAVKNLTLANAVVHSTQYCIGIVVGVNLGTMENCHVPAGSSVATSYSNSQAGGIVGNNCGLLMGCTHAAAVKGTNSVGGIAGLNGYGGRIIACANTGTVDVTNTQSGSGYTYACWSTASNDLDENYGDSNSGGSRTACYIITTSDGSPTVSVPDGATSTTAANIADAITAMNAAIVAYNANEENAVKCPYTWQAGTDGYPTLVKSE